ncbi:MAG TPA: HAD-IB family phosphatase [Candidatus Thermoplasmatota archaeon]|nr:HAD-IB family phosphatase [Candidatus Thermoplasmatota archaeon]
MSRSPPRPAPPPGLVFLDFDNTIIHGDAGPLFGWYLFRWRRHELEGRFWARMRLWGRYVPFLSWMGLQAGLYKVGARRRSSIIRASYKGLRGVDALRFYGLMEDFAREAIAPRLYPEMVGIMRDHQAKGRRCVVVTTGMEALVRRVLDHVDPAIDLIGCRLPERNGRLTGRVVGPLFGVDKANILDAYARALGVPLAECWAYSDHWSDKHMLETVGHPVAVNPRGKLHRMAKRMGWPVLHPLRAD